MRLILTTLTVLALAATSAAAPDRAHTRRLALEAQKYWVYCIDDKVSVDDVGPGADEGAAGLGRLPASRKHVDVRRDVVDGEELPHQDLLLRGVTVSAGGFG